MYLHFLKGKATTGTGISKRGTRTTLEAPATAHNVHSPQAQLRIRRARRLLSVLAAPKLAETNHGSAEGGDAEYDPLRDGPLRFLGYSNEVGEAFGMLIPPQLVAASYAVAITYVLVDTVDKFSRARSSARNTLTLAAAAGDNMNATELQVATTAAAFSNADPADPPHLTKSDKAAMAASSHKDISSTPTTAAGYAHDPLDEAQIGAGAAVGASSSVRDPPQLAPTPSPPSPTAAAAYTTVASGPPVEMFAEALPFSGAAAGAGGGMWDSGYSSSSSSSGISGMSAVGDGQQGASLKSGLDRGLDNAAGIIDAAGVVSGTGGGAGSVGSRGGNAGVGGGLILSGKGRLSKEEENAALVVGGLKALDTVVWQMLASVMIPGFIIHQSVHLATHSLSSPAGLKTLTLGANAFGRVVGMDLSATLPGYIINALPVALGLALVPIICHPIDSVVDKLLDSTLRPVLRKYRLQLQQEQQRPAP
uniref:Mitochondrial fission process protein 1 n=1 Tax=Dunaliella tertiolecta TaxID=3047 RepID=A0A7S3QZZ7_DUNTE|mmetsp:Transcript_441/g.1125  ORF Transcript_441/g.1125 Transcript_441/m.1125 type:complete len:478 (-) Transcript_441:501-1934(-)